VFKASKKTDGELVIFKQIEMPSDEVKFVEADDRDPE